MRTYFRTQAEGRRLDELDALLGYAQVSDLSKLAPPDKLAAKLRGE